MTPAPTSARSPVPLAHRPARYWMAQSHWFVMCPCGWEGEADTKARATQLDRSHQRDAGGWGALPTSALAT